MNQFTSIVVIHPGAIGDTVMGTPVAAALRRHFREANIAYLTHPGLFPLLELAGCIDCFLPWEKQASIFQLGRTVRDQAPQLVIDLVGSLKTRAVALQSGARILTLRKHHDLKRGLHVVDSYLQTLTSLNVNSSTPPFPSLFTPPALVQALGDSEVPLDELPLIALVPGVGSIRPHRAWPLSHWEELARELWRKHKLPVVLIGGADDVAACRKLRASLGDKVYDVAGKLTLVETAALLSRVSVVVSGDTGPCHIAVAVGAKVICLTGPTHPGRSGPYGMAQLGLHAGDCCSCSHAKQCSFNPGGAGRCMQQIVPADVLVKIEQILAEDVSPARKDVRATK